MKKSTKLCILASLTALSLIVAGCGGDKKDNAKADANAPIKVGVTAGPHAEIMDNVVKLAAKDGLKVQAVEFSDFVTPNVALADKQLFANSMQHLPYLKATLQKNPKWELVNCFNTVSFPMAIYSNKIKKLEEIKEGMTVAIPNDPSNGGRALLVLADKGIIKVKDVKDIKTSVADITLNPKKLKIKELDAAAIPKALGDVDFAVINANYAMVAKLNPKKDAISIERADNPYVCIFVTTKANEKDPRIAQLKKIYQSAENKKFIDEHFKGSILAGF